MNMAEIIESSSQIASGLNSLTPLGLAAGLAYVIYLLVRNQKGQDKIASNHLHDLPEAVENSREMLSSLKRIEEKLEKMNDGITYIRGRINGKDQ